MMQPLLTYALIAGTCLISLMNMNNREFKMRFMFSAYAIDKNREWWRFFTGGFLHADFGHLLFNMFSFYFFGTLVEQTFKMEFGMGIGTLMYLALYVTSLPASNIYTYFRQRDNPNYFALGASGAVSAVIYASILVYPLQHIFIYFISVPAWIFGIVYLGISWVMARNKSDNIGHDAHFFGAVYGFLFPAIFNPSLLSRFVEQIEMFFRFGGNFFGH
ncbi:MAG TPA: rhomboid family intramembrane serine protease [Bacteroidia bacterium]|nr:rhomboid family intramembrane serine protease [Bacteroidia bacterium]